MIDIDKEKVIKLIFGLIDNKHTALNVKYLKSHEKVAILYKEHVIEIVGGEEKYLKYADIKIPLSNAEHKELHKRFMEEIKLRKANYSEEKFAELERIVEEKMKNKNKK